MNKYSKCVCCNNPWNQGGSESSAVYSSFAMTCGDCTTVPGIDTNNFDHTVSPKDNFYLWSNGGWKEDNPIPAEYSSWNTFIQLRDLNLDRLKKIVDDLQNDSSSVSSDNSKKLSMFFNTMMDQEKIETRGVEPLLPVIELCKTVRSNATAVIAALHSQYHISALFSLHSSPDKRDAEHTIGALYQGGLGLLDRDYYFDADKAEKREAYQLYIQKVFALLGDNGVADYATEEAQKEASKQVFGLETSLASAHLTRTACRDPELTYNKKSLDEISLMCTEFAAKRHIEDQLTSSPGLSWATYLTSSVPCLTSPPAAADLLSRFNWDEYFKLIGKDKDHLGDVNVATIDAIEKVFELLCLSESSDLQHYLIFHTVLRYSDCHLPMSFKEAHFEFFEKELKGTTEMKPRWKTVLAAMEEALGEAFGEIYVAQFFPADAKDRALRVVNRVKDALHERLLEIDWMSDSTRAEAIRKMNKFRVKIGFPDTWIDYSSLKLVDGYHFENITAARKFNYQLEINRINAPTDRERWFMTPQTVNAYYHPSLNEIVFPAAILQPPFFDPEADEAVNFGSLGAVVGHEMTHGFDDQGRKYDSCGNMRDWWTSEDGTEYEARVAVMIRQAEKFEVHGKKLNGKLTCGENIADLGGVKLALRALKKLLAEEEAAGVTSPLLNGFTPKQRFFLAWSQAWRENVKKERALQLVTLDPHGPNEMRCNGTLSNIQEFFDAFEITVGSPMFVDESDRVDIW